MRHRTLAELVDFESELRAAPADDGRLDLVVRRPGFAEREVLSHGRLTLADGLEGDTWNVRPSKRTADGSRHPDMQLNVMSSRMVRVLAGNDPDRQALAGDQLYVDLDLSVANLPAGTRLAVGEAVIEVTDQLHAGCPKFVDRFGADAMRFVNGRLGRELRLRGLNARVVHEGVVRPGDEVRKLPGGSPGS